MTQKYKAVEIVTGTEIYFVDHAFDSAYQQLERFMQRNAPNSEWQAYYRNTSPFGPTWKHERSLV